MNTINKLQNTKAQLNYLAAQRQLYSDAKNTQLVRVIFSIPGAIIISIIAAMFPQSQAYAALYGIIVTLFDLIILTPTKKSMQEKAAKIQELFDSKVLQIKWNDLKVGLMPNTEEVFEASFKYLEKNIDYLLLKNWYPSSVSKLPLYLGRVICQRTNCWWDAKLRKKYAYFLIILTFIVTAIILLIGLIGSMTLEKFILVVALPLLPVYVFSISEYQDHTESANLIDRVKESCENMWRSILRKQLNVNQIENFSRNLQDEIYDRRRQSPLIFDWVYRLLRDSYEQQMNVGAEHLIKEARNL